LTVHNAGRQHEYQVSMRYDSLSSGRDNLKFWKPGMFFKKSPPY